MLIILPFNCPYSYKTHMVDDFIVEVNDMDEGDFHLTHDHGSSLFMLIGIVLSACSQLVFYPNQHPALRHLHISRSSDCNMFLHSI